MAWAALHHQRETIDIVIRRSLNGLLHSARIIEWIHVLSARACDRYHSTRCTAGFNGWKSNLWRRPAHRSGPARLYAAVWKLPLICKSNKSSKQMRADDGSPWKIPAAPTQGGKEGRWLVREKLLSRVYSQLSGYDYSAGPPLGDRGGLSCGERAQLLLFHHLRSFPSSSIQDFGLV